MSMSASHLRSILVVALAVSALTISVVLAEEPQDEESFSVPGGMAAIPSALPGIPTVSNQLIPAVAPASGEGSRAWVGTFCDPILGTSGCANDPGFNTLRILFRLRQAFPTPGGPTGATFAASGTNKLVCADGALCDFGPVGDNTIIVEVNGAGVNELVQVIACEATGSTPDEDGCPYDADKRSLNIMFVETILALPQALPSASPGLSLVAYRCPEVGPAPLFVGDPTDPDAIDDPLTMEDLWNMQGPGGMNLDFLNGGGGIDALFYDKGTLRSCGGTTGTAADDSVHFETNLGDLSVASHASAAAARNAPPTNVTLTLDASCAGGDAIDVLDSPALTASAPGEMCDLDFAPNGVVTYGLGAFGDIGLATVGAGQTGIVPPVPRSLYVALIGPGTMMAFAGPPAVVESDGADFEIALFDITGRPVSGAPLECRVEPETHTLALVPQTPSTGADGMARFRWLPAVGSAIGGEMLDVICELDAERSVSASANFSLSSSWDADADGCAGQEELGPDKSLGGQRDPFNPYDFYDITDLTLRVGAKDGRVTGFDLSLLVSYGGTEDDGPPNAVGRDYDADSNGNGIDDGREIDFASIIGPAAGPDGAITGFDLSAMVNQGGDSCLGPP